MPPGTGTAEVKMAALAGIPIFLSIPTQCEAAMRTGAFYVLHSHRSTGPGSSCSHSPRAQALALIP